MRLKAIYLLAILTAIILGIGSRRFSQHLPSFVSEHFGDMFWAAMVYFGFRLIWTNRKLSFAVAAGFIFSYMIEFSQLYQTDWINGIRATSLGSLILGKGFLVADLFRYAAGIIIAYFMDSYAIQRKKWPAHKSH
jgi:hypothetical protein